MRTDTKFMILGLVLLAIGGLCLLVDPVQFREGDPTQFTEHPIGMLSIVFGGFGMSSMLATAVGAKN